MKKIPLLIITSLLCCTFLSAQDMDMGFRTTDIGAEVKKKKHTAVYNLHVAFNAKLHHSVQLRIGYCNVGRFSSGYNTEYGNGWGGGIGYRYYFKPFPHKFFIGARADGFVMNIDGETDYLGVPAVYPKKRFLFIPSAEAGYTLVINDYFYITPAVSAGYKTGRHEPDAMYYEPGGLIRASLIAGFRF